MIEGRGHISTVAKQSIWCWPKEDRIPSKVLVLCIKNLYSEILLIHFDSLRILNLSEVLDKFKTECPKMYQRKYWQFV